MRFRTALTAGVAASLTLAPHLLAGFEDDIAALLAVGPEGAGNAEAAAAWSRLTATAEPDALLACLGAIDDASPVAANWLRSAAEVIAEGCAETEGGLPVEALGEFLLERSHAARPRRFAFELIAKADPALAESLVPGMIADPSPELRRDAVARLMDEAEAARAGGSEGAAAVLYRQALGAAVEPDQVRPIADALKGLGATVDLPRHFGFLTHWHVVGPFDNSGRAGFDKVFAPEKGEVDLAASYGGGEGPLRWQPLATGDPFGKVDLNKPFGMLKEKVAYAHAVYVAPASRAAEIRIGTKNAFKVWLNGELVFARDEYHRGQRIDQYQLPVQLREGDNAILVKVCQNEQTEEWTVQWEFQLRVCDSSGDALLASNRLPTPAPEQARERRRPNR